MRIEEAKTFIKNNARPLELSLYRYFFEDGIREDVIRELMKYQNADGGFGRGLEADNWNPNSNPIAVNDALFTLYRIGGLEKNSEIVKKIIMYLNSHDSFDEEKKRWLFSIESNKNYPHAMWWEKGDTDGINGFNPTASLAAFMVCYGENTDIYSGIVQEAVEYLKEADELGGDTLKCYLLAYEMLTMNKVNNIVDMNYFFELLQKRILDTICTDTEKYGVEYVTAPSDFFDGRYNEFVNSKIQELIDIEKGLIDKLQKDDGGFDISWTWFNGYSEFEQARAWWRPLITLNKLMFLQSTE